MKRYPAKLLLFGEHTVNLGSRALAVPLWHYHAGWRFATAAELPHLPRLQQQLPAFAKHLAALQQTGQLPFELDVDAFEKALQQGLWLDSDIPQGYGAGSSGALVAAVVGEWGGELPPRLDRLREGLARMEAFFHGKSSGTDPLVSLLQKPLLISRQGAEPTELPDVSSLGFFLLDSGLQRKAGPLIERFLQAWQRPDFSQACKHTLLPAVDAAIATMHAGKYGALFEAFKTISAFQLQHMHWLIPEELHAPWKEGLDSGGYLLKICGAGGGGFVLGMLAEGVNLEDFDWPLPVFML